jgi:peptide-methionine (R)-S-oxide reductase
VGVRGPTAKRGVTRYDSAMRTNISRGQLLALAMAAAAGGLVARARSGAAEHFAVTHTDAEWRRLLTPAQYDVLRQEGTEPPGSSPLDHEHARGTYFCVGCSLALFSSTTKFDSGTGWPSFYAALHNAVATRSDGSLGVERTEVHCRRCGGHLGHVFDDGPKPTGLRYCMNGVALRFEPAKTG